MNSLAHIEINVTNLETSTAFWDKFLTQLEWEKFDVGDSAVVGFEALDGAHIFLVQAEGDFLGGGFHRKNVGLNHIALRVESDHKVDQFHKFLKDGGIPILYGDCPKDYSSEYGRERYYAVFFEDPDRIKIEVVFYK